MKTAIVTIKGVTPYFQSKHHTTPKLEKESANAYEKRTWRERAHVSEDGNVIIPAVAFKLCLDEVASHLSVKIKGKGQATYTKHFLCGILVPDPLILPVKKDAVAGQWLFVPADGKKGGGKRVDRCYPVIHQWGGDVTFHILDEVIEKSTFEYHIEEAGKLTGLGMWRPKRGGQGGRFDVTKIKWS